MTRGSFLVEVDIPNGMNANDMRGFIENAAHCESGHVLPGDPRFHVDNDSIVVSVQKVES